MHQTKARKRNRKHAHTKYSSRTSLRLAPPLSPPCSPTQRTAQPIRTAPQRVAASGRQLRKPEREGGGRKGQESQGKRARPPPPSPIPRPASRRVESPWTPATAPIPRASPRRAGPGRSAPPPRPLLRCASGCFRRRRRVSSLAGALPCRLGREWPGRRISSGDAAVSVAARSVARGTAAAVRLPAARPA